MTPTTPYTGEADLEWSLAESGILVVADRCGTCQRLVKEMDLIWDYLRDNHGVPVRPTTIYQTSAGEWFEYFNEFEFIQIKAKTKDEAIHSIRRRIKDRRRRELKNYRPPARVINCDLIDL